MADLDYAFLADFAKVEANGTLTSVGASFTFLEAAQLPAAHRLSVAGRVRALVGETPDLRVDVRGPDDLFRLGVNGPLTHSVNARPYAEGRIGILFALDLQVPLPAAGLYSVGIEVDGTEVRRLAFEVARTDEVQ